MVAGYPRLGRLVRRDAVGVESIRDRLLLCSRRRWRLWGVPEPETRYARSGDVSIAYQVSGGGPFDLVVCPGWITNVELMWDDAKYRAHFERLGSFARLIRF